MSGAKLNIVDSRRRTHQYVLIDRSRFYVYDPIARLRWRLRL
jgi:hypothetical protein